MSESKTAASEIADAEVEVILHGEGPFAAAHVGALLSAMAVDYRRMNRGRELIVVRIERGSLETVLADAGAYAAMAGVVGAAVLPYIDKATEIAKGVQSIEKFSKAVRGVFQKSRKDPGEVLGPGPKQPGQRTVEALLEAAINTGSEVEYKKVAADGASEEIRITPPEAVKTRERAKLEAAVRSVQRVLDAPPAQAQLTGPPRPSLGLAANDEDLAILKGERDRLRDAMLSLSGPPGPLAGGEVSELEAFVAAVVATLRRAGTVRLLEMLVEDLDRAGHHHVAEMVRRALRGGPADPVTA